MTIAIIIGFVIIVILAAKKQIYDQKTRQITGSMFQMLESFKIIDSTVKLDIFTQRLDFLRKLAISLPQNEDLKHFADISLNAYTRKYPKVSITPTFRLIIQQPQVACSSKFRDEAATAFYMRVCGKLKEDISTLKTKAAKQRRIKQAEELAETIIDTLCSTEKARYVEAIRETCAGVSPLSSD